MERERERERERDGRRVNRREEKQRPGEERTRESLFVTVSGLSRSIISRKVLLTALIFRLFLPLSLVSLFFFPLTSPTPSRPVAGSLFVFNR